GLYSSAPLGPLLIAAQSSHRQSDCIPTQALCRGLIVTRGFRFHFGSCAAAGLVFVARSTPYSFAANGESARSHCRIRRWLRVSPLALASVRRSSGLSTSRAMPGKESTTQGFPVASAA